MVLCGALMDRIRRLCKLETSRNFQWIRPGRRRYQINPSAAALRPGSAPPGQGLLGDARVGTNSALGACGALSRALSRKAGAKCGPFSVVPEERRLCPSQRQHTSRKWPTQREPTPKSLRKWPTQRGEATNLR
jgi:hypothetical protein